MPSFVVSCTVAMATSRDSLTSFTPFDAVPCESSVLPTVFQSITLELAGA